MSKYYDPWIHALEIFTTRLIQFLGLVLVLGLLIWWAWLHFYFDVDVLATTKATFSRKGGLLLALLSMCFVTSALIVGWLFSWLIRKIKPKNENHYRGSRLQN